MNYVLVFIGGGIGSIFRHGISRASLARVGQNFPASTVFVNVVGSTVIGLLVGWLASRSGDSQSLRLFLTTGIIGGFTTFSAFSLDTVVLWERGDYSAAALYVLGSVTISIAGLFTGLAALRSMT